MRRNRAGANQSDCVGTPAVYHTPTPHRSLQECRRSLRCNHCCRCSSRVSMAHPLSPPASSVYDHPMAAARRIDDILPTAALDVALRPSMKTNATTPMTTSTRIPLV